MTGAVSRNKHRTARRASAIFMAGASIAARDARPLPAGFATPMPGRLHLQVALEQWHEGTSNLDAEPILLPRQRTPDRVQFARPAAAGLVVAAAPPMRR